MKKIVLSICLVLFSNLLPAQNFIGKEILGRPTNNSIVVHAMFADSVDVRVQYGLSSGALTNQTSWQTFADSTPVEVLINNLTADTKYFYKLNYRLHGTSTVNLGQEHSFHTARNSGSAFSFIVQADPHLDASSDTLIYNRTLQNELEDNPDFMIDLGDFLMTDKLTNSSGVVPYDTISYRCRLLRSFYEKSCHSVPLYNVLGNHEGESGWYNNGTSNNIAVWNTIERKKYFPNPFPNNFYKGDTTNYNFIGQRAAYYAWEWGDGLFVVIDPYWFTKPKPDSLNCWRWTLGKEQYNWLKSVLENSNAKFKFVFSHQIVGGSHLGRGGIEYADKYEWGGNNLDGTPGFSTNRPGWYKPIKDLFKENRVTIFFHGHDHFFGKQEKDCLIYQETPQPSHPNYNSNSATAYGYLTGQFLPNSGHIRLTVDSNGTKVEYVRSYKPADESATRHNKDISATYFIGKVNCYDSISNDIPVLWNSNYADEIVYPNPFQKDITLSLDFIQSATIDVNIYDQQGRLVRQLLHHAKVEAGNYKLVWDGNQNNGSSLPSGQYYYKIIASNGWQSGGKMTLIR